MKCACIDLVLQRFRATSGASARPRPGSGFAVLFQRGTSMRTQCRPLFLTPRERRALQLLANDHTVDAVAADLGVGTSTCERLLTRLFAALGVATHVEAIVDARRRGLLTDSPINGGSGESLNA